MATIFQDFDNTKHAFLNPQDFTKPVAAFPTLCITTFSESIIQKFARMDGVRIIANLYSANGIIPVYEINYEGSPIAFFLSRVGAPACVAGLEEVIAMGAGKIVMFGCAGILYGADSLDGDNWIPNDLLKYGLDGSEKYMALAFECAICM